MCPRRLLEHAVGVVGDRLEHAAERRHRAQRLVEELGRAVEIAELHQDEAEVGEREQRRVHVVELAGERECLLVRGDRPLQLAGRRPGHPDVAQLEREHHPVVETSHHVGRLLPPRRGRREIAAQVGDRSESAERHRHAPGRPGGAQLGQRSLVQRLRAIELTRSPGEVAERVPAGGGPDPVTEALADLERQLDVHARCGDVAECLRQLAGGERCVRQTSRRRPRPQRHHPLGARSAVGGVAADPPVAPHPRDEPQRSLVVRVAPGGREPTQRSDHVVVLLLEPSERIRLP